MHAVIIGAGIGGLAAGVALRRLGVRVTMLERAPALRVEGSGIVLWANAVRALRELGVPWRVMGGEIVRMSEVCRPSGRVLSRFDVRSADAEAGTPSLVVRRGDLMHALRWAYERLEGTIRFDAAVTGLAQIEDDAGNPLPPAVILSSGEAVEASFIVAADGAGSVAFRTLHPGLPAKPTGETCWRAIVPWPEDREIPRGLMREVWGRGARFGINRIDDEHVFVWAMGPRPAETPIAELDHLALLRARYGRWAGPVPELVERMADREIMCHDIKDRAPSRDWGRGLVTLLGDAAHPTTPHLGQSGCMAIEDAAELGRCIGASLMRMELTPAGITRTLRAYEGARFGRTARITRLSRRVATLGMVRSRVACAVRDAVMAAIPQVVQRRQHEWLTGVRRA